MTNNTAAKIAATEILEKQKGIANLRKAVTQAKTKLDDAKRTLRWAQDAVNAALERGDIDNAEYNRGRVTGAESCLPVLQEKLEAAKAELAKAEAELPAVKPSAFAAILKWFSGTALVKAKDALELVDASVAHGSWLPGASRRVWAALKPNVAKKNLKVSSAYDAPAAEGAIRFAIDYGSFGRLAALSLQDATRDLNDDALEFFIDFRPLIDTLTTLDATRPVPVFTKLGASPTVTAELERQGAVSVEVAEIVYERHEGIDKKTGKKFYYVVAKIIWPEGCQHNTSRYAYGTAHNFQCHACGHAIRNNCNWVPLVLTDKAGGKKSLWVGRDCAETLFGVKLTGDLELAEGQR